MNADGSGQRAAQLSGKRGRSQMYLPAGHVVWSPDGHRLALSVEDAHATHLYVANRDGTGRRELARVGVPDECFEADWSPDGSKLVYGEGCEVDFTRMFVVNRDGSGRRRIARSFDSLRPQWSPSGGSILFAGFGPRDHRYSLFRVGADGGRPHLIPESSLNPVPLDAWSWSRDGKRIYLLDWQLFVMNRDGSHRRNLTGQRLHVGVGSFSPSPDGREIVITASDGRGSDWEIYVMNADGSELRQLTNNRAQDTDPQWSPDGRRVAFTRASGGNAEIYVMNADGSDQTDISRSPARDETPSWLPPLRTG